ncbi:MAG TPA: FAD-dependent oxidoreductase [Aggregatilineales bacterium]|nr:FAD-dependent oxidoreductase [Aggregatilineales bacterium]
MTANVVVIGGGLSGLAAAHELQQHRIPYTLIEVKPRLGGSIATVQRAGFALESGPLLTQDGADAPFLERLGLRESVFTARVDEEGEWLAFKRGTQTLIDALAAPLTGTHMLRMAVSTLGTLDTPRGTRFGVCLENGILLDAAAVIVAAPARYAERILHTLRQEISFQLLDYRYDSIVRVSLGYPVSAAPLLPDEPPADYPVCYIHTLTHAAAPERVPEGQVLVQAGIRYDPLKGLSPAVAGEFAALFGLPEQPVVQQVSVWPESDPIMWLDDAAHARAMVLISDWLPDGVALAGSDYVVTGDHHPTLGERIEHGRQAARRVLAAL